ncbi:nose resistant to fluoxetine protein 6 isoform X1 [Ceratina calcarata]|uniref:Nose resistant to fluoxetine protein 6 isoform X1 n=1 Tax=Ceratina calcarata TaxID=156304 RepID=A0AAJ7JE30_9HYME|nr:nose resistant to fluoxetine protein 6 isoform X1 [Ceratina calcarata]XP_026674905.1 nose resistant to fluoxetine protein 6 isoform X1 [Ceratina calcarata]XP_026674906.1 nose resistant to fluoxetine protein 6 isoform X1 [Ceratina calcarata]
MGGFIRAWTIFLLIKLSYSGKSVDILTSSTLNTLEEEEILRVLSRNTTTSSNNFTLTDLIEHLKNETFEASNNSAKKLEINPFYDEFSEEIDREARTLLQILPAYDPGVGRVSPECKRHSDIFHQELAKFTLWALKMYDATAKIPSGLLNGNVNQFGDFDECIGVQGSEGIQGQYCLAYLELSVDESRPDLKHLHRLLHSHYAFRSNITDPGHRVPRYTIINWAVCTPASCSFKDVETSIRDTVTKYTLQTGLKVKVTVNKEMCQVKGKDPLPRETVIVSLFFLVIFALAIIAAYYDHYEIPASELLLSFSLKRNFKSLVSVERKQNDIATLHGVRAINALMLLLAHKSMALFFNPYMNRTEMSEYLGKPWTVIGRAASLYTDPFIMLSGLLTSYSFIGKLRRTGNLNIINEYFSRWIRVVPSLAALMLFCTYIIPYIGSGPQWNLVVTEHANICKRTWWRNFLFIHNYFGFESMCLTHTHHLGIDTQLFILSPLMVILLYKKPKTGSIVLTMCALISTALRYFVTYYRQLNNYVFFGTSIKQLFDTANYSYTLPAHRLTIYIVGIFLGYLLRYLPRDYKINKIALRTGWILCTIMFCCAFFGPAGMGSIDYVYNPIDAAMYNAFAPIGWCALFAWATVMYHTKNTNGWFSRFLAWKGFLITTRLSYAIYLTQFPIYFYNVGRTRSAEYFDFFKMQFNLAEFLWIVTLSITLTLLFDTPFQNIKDYLMRKSPMPEAAVKPLKRE